MTPIRLQPQTGIRAPPGEIRVVEFPGEPAIFRLQQAFQQLHLPLKFRDRGKAADVRQALGAMKPHHSMHSIHGLHIRIEIVQAEGGWRNPLGLAPNVNIGDGRKFDQPLEHLDQHGLVFGCTQVPGEGQQAQGIDARPTDTGLENQPPFTGLHKNYKLNSQEPSCCYPFSSWKKSKMN
jgi:hypothetical protein